MDDYGSVVNGLVQELSRLPGIGQRSAVRLAFHILRMPKEEAQALASAVVAANQEVHYCKECGNLTDGDLCPVCADTTRDHSLIMVVEDVRDLAAYERTKQYKGVYHILQGVISPLSGVSPDDLRIKELLERIGRGQVKEVIIATNPTVEGETTAMYLSRILKPLGIQVTRIANGVPVGGDLEYIDEVTLARALEGRVSL